MLNTTSGWTFICKEDGSRGSDRESGKFCGKTMVFYKTNEIT